MSHFKYAYHTSHSTLWHHVYSYQGTCSNPPVMPRRFQTFPVKAIQTLRLMFLVSNSVLLNHNIIVIGRIDNFRFHVLNFEMSSLSYNDKCKLGRLSSPQPFARAMVSCRRSQNSHLLKYKTHEVLSCTIKTSDGYLLKIAASVIEDRNLPSFKSVCTPLCCCYWQNK